MPNFLLELCSEEIPSRMHADARAQLERLFKTGLEKAGLSYSAIRTFSSPRHLAIHVAGLPEKSPDVTEEIKGPKLGAPAQALEGFTKKTGLSLAQCEQRVVGKDTLYFATITRKGETTSALLQNLCQPVLTDFAWPKSMRWGAHSLRWVRPLHHIVALLDSTVLPVSFGHLNASNITLGHRFLAPAAITLKHADDYEAALKAAFVTVDADARKAEIKQQIENIATDNHLTLVADEGLLEEVTGLVEYPTAMLGTFEDSFLSLPPEVLISEMKHHQRYFALYGANGKLSNSFIAVTNMQNPSQKVIAGNARVLRARLSDGAFYFKTDREKPLADWGKGLADVVFHNVAGMMNEKVARIEFIAETLNKLLPETSAVDESSLILTAHLCKADLVTGMVGEFPDLQGIMGRYYALEQGISADVADAIRDHYKPKGAADSVAETSLAAIVAIADKLDSIVSLFAAGEKPTGSKDPLALRRSALGILRILFHYQMDISLEVLVRSAIRIYAGNNYYRETAKSLEKLDSMKGEIPPLFVEEAAVKAAGAVKAFDPKESMIPGWESAEDKITEEVIEFFCDRLKQMLRDEGLGHDVIEAALAIQESGFNPVAIAARARTLAAWSSTAQGRETIAAIKRTQNILAAEEKKQKAPIVIDTSKNASLQKPEEQKLWQTVQQVKHTSVENLEKLAAPINAFFEASLVTEEGFRDARLSLLASVRECANTIADFSKLEG
jgi:glycyl-tRNA synthetase beta chain